MKTCLFCENTKLTREHIYSQWLFKFFKPSAKVFNPQILSYYNSKSNSEADLFNLERKINFEDFEVKCVCGECNGGWMSKLEILAKNSFKKYSLFNEPDLNISSEDAHTLSEWAILKLILASYTTSVNKIELSNQFYKLLSKDIIPEGFIVEICKMKGEGLNYAIGEARLRKSFDISRAELDFACDDYIQASMQIGRIAFRVTYLRTMIAVYRQQIQIKMKVLFLFIAKISFHRDENLEYLMDEAIGNLELPILNSFMAVID